MQTYYFTSFFFSSFVVVVVVVVTFFLCYFFFSLWFIGLLHRFFLFCVCFFGQTLTIAICNIAKLFIAKLQ